MLEGVVDLALVQTSDQKLFILDWKTDRVPPDNVETLRKRYRPQLAAYWKAISEITKMEVAVGIYSTGAGALVRYQTNELEKEWARLEKLSPEELDATVASVRQPSTKAPTQLEFAVFTEPGKG